MSNFLKKASDWVVDFHTALTPDDSITLIKDGTDEYDPTTMTETRENTEGEIIPVFRSHRKSKDHNTDGESYSSHFYLVKLDNIPDDYDLENYEDLRLLDMNGQERKILGIETDMVKSFVRIWIEEV